MFCGDSFGLTDLDIKPGGIKIGPGRDKLC